MKGSASERWQNAKRVRRSTSPSRMGVDSRSDVGNVLLGSFIKQFPFVLGRDLVMLTTQTVAATPTALLAAAGD